ncbi:MAG: tRNA (adenosine(37)-N6)-threonylcarbamoyltransferase complex dimerization subunit type 1 TsaB [Candidatus Limnocylindrales bacterium]
MTADRHGTTILAIDTATTQVVIATGSPDGALRAVSTWTAGYRHGETLLPGIERFLDAYGVGRADLAGIVVGTGPGAFTGLRVGIATAKGLAHGLGIPLVGVSTAEALISSAAAEPAAAEPRRPSQRRRDGIDPSRFVLLVPAGPSDRVMIRTGAEPRLLAGGLIRSCYRSWILQRSCSRWTSPAVRRRRQWPWARPPDRDWAPRCSAPGQRDSGPRSVPPANWPNSSRAT